MNKFLLLLLIVIIFSCKTKKQKSADVYNNTKITDSIKEVDEYYDKFKNEISNDSMNSYAQSDAEYVANYHYDSLKKKEAEEWLLKYDKYMKSIEEYNANYKIDKQAFLRRNLKISKTLYKEEHCNFLQQHILVASYTDNKDSLTRAVEILADSIWNTIPFSSDCIKNVRCGVYLYKKKSDFELNGWRKWFVMGTKISGQEPRVMF